MAASTPTGLQPYALLFRCGYCLAEVRAGARPELAHEVVNVAFDAGWTSRAGVIGCPEHAERAEEERLRKPRLP